jgi:hypothetical protein
MHTRLYVAVVHVRPRAVNSQCIYLYVRMGLPKQQKPSLTSGPLSMGLQVLKSHAGRVLSFSSRWPGPCLNCWNPPFDSLSAMFEILNADEFKN